MPPPPDDGFWVFKSSRLPSSSRSKALKLSKAQGFWAFESPRHLGFSKLQATELLKAQGCQGPEGRRTLETNLLTLLTSCYWWKFYCSYICTQINKSVIYLLITSESSMKCNNKAFRIYFSTFSFFYMRCFTFLFVAILVIWYYQQQSIQHFSFLWFVFSFYRRQINSQSGGSHLDLLHNVLSSSDHPGFPAQQLNVNSFTHFAASHHFTRGIITGEAPWLADEGPRKASPGSRWQENLTWI